MDAVARISELGVLDIWRWRRRFRKELVSSRRYSRTEHVTKFVKAYAELLLLKLHVVKKAKKQVYSGGMTIAVLGADGAGNPALGAPSLVDDAWLYGGSEADVRHSIADGREGRMPAHGEFLGEARVHMLAAWVWSLSNR